MVRISKSDLAATEQRIMRHISVSQANLDAQAHLTRDALIKAVREALAPAPGVRVLLADRPVDYPTAVSWDIGHGNLIVNLAGGDIAAEFAHGEWRGVERMTSEETL